jgi:hypothetical protein
MLILAVLVILFLIYAGFNFHWFSGPTTTIQNTTNNSQPANNSQPTSAPSTAPSKTP